MHPHGMIDFHSHFFSAVFFETLAKLSPQPGSVEEKLSRVATKVGLELPNPSVAAHWQRWQDELDRHGVERIVSFASVPEEAPALAEARELSQGRLIPFALVNPLGDGAADRARSLLTEKGFKGLLFFPAMHRFDPSCEQAMAVYEQVDAARAVAVVHCGMLQVKIRDLLGIPRPYDFRHADPLLLAPAANRFKNATFVIPHFGAGMLRETLMLGSQCENVCVDSSSSNSWLDTQACDIDLAGVFRKAYQVFGGSRVLFGTDSSTFPRGWRKDLFDAQYAALDRAGIPARARDEIFVGNAKRLLAL